MSYEIQVPPPPVPSPVDILHEEQQHPGGMPVAPAARPAAGFDATAVVLPAPTPGVTTYRLRGTQTTRVE
jgi:hypothetical protein